MNWKLLVFSTLLGTVTSVMVGAAIFFLFPQLSNFNVEDYIIAAALLTAAVTAIFSYRRAAQRKFLHAFFVFAAVCISTLAVFMLVVLALVLLICAGSSPCKIIPFL